MSHEEKYKSDKSKGKNWNFKGMGIHIFINIKYFIKRVCSVCCFVEKNCVFEMLDVEGLIQ